MAAQAMFPVTSGTEMAGQPGENSIADAAAIGDLAGPDGVWAQIAERLQGIQDYVDQFVAVYDDVTVAEDITYVHVANAMAAFEAVNWRSDNSPFDRYQAGDEGALNPQQRRGLQAFQDAGCQTCHSGPMFSDFEPHTIAVREHPDLPSPDIGFAGEYAFRTPTLRNLRFTAPYFHDGSLPTLASNAVYSSPLT